MNFTLRQVEADGPKESLKTPIHTFWAKKGLLNISLPLQIKARDEPNIGSGRECSKKSVQQGRSPFDARSVLSVREHGKMARTLLAAFFNIPKKDFTQFPTK